MNKLTQNGVVVKDAQALMDTLRNTEGFEAVLKAKEKKKLPDIVQSKTGKGVLKILDWLGYTVIFGGNVYDNCYNESKEEWDVNGYAVADVVTDTAIDIGLDQGIQVASAALGTALIPIPYVGTVVGYLAGAAISTWISRAEWGEPPKTVVDGIKDFVSDITHPIGDALSNIFW